MNKQGLPISSTQTGRIALKKGQVMTAFGPITANAPHCRRNDYGPAPDGPAPNGPES